MDGRQKVRALAAAGSSLVLKLGAQVTGLPRSVKGRQLTGRYRPTFARVHSADHSWMGRPLPPTRRSSGSARSHAPEIRLQVFAGAVGGLTLLAIGFPELLSSQLGWLLILCALLAAALHLLASIWSGTTALLAAREILGVGSCACMAVYLADWLCRALLAQLLNAG